MNHLIPMIVEENKEQNESYIFKNVLLRPDNTDFIPSIIRGAEAHKTRIHWTLIKSVKSTINIKKMN